MIFTPATSFGETPPDELKNPYERLKNGMPLTNIIHKVPPKWLFSWLRDPSQHNPEAKMPNLELEADEIKAVIAFLSSIADKEPPKVSWPPYLLKSEDDMTDEEYEELDTLLENGRNIWRQARCTICHTVRGPVDELIGGYVNLRVGIDLSHITSEVNRDWLYNWLRDPKQYFPGTLMPRYRFTDAERRALVEFIMRDESFMPEEDEEYKDDGDEIVISSDPDVIKRGKRLVELSRCAVCHDIKRVKNLIKERKEKAPQGAFPKLLSEVRCLSCHSIRGRGGDYAPDLTYAGSKLKAEWIANFLHAPDSIRLLSQQMPKFNLTLEEARSVSRYVKKHLTHPDIRVDFLEGKRISKLQVEEGKKIFHQKGCQACHAIGGEGGALGPDLAYVGDRLETAYIYFHLKNTNRIDPYTVEPDYGLSDTEAKALTHFLASQARKNREAGR